MTVAEQSQMPKRYINSSLLKSRSPGGNLRGINFVDVALEKGIASVEELV